MMPNHVRPDFGNEITKNIALLFFCRVAVLRHATVINGNHALAVPEYLRVKAGVVASCHVGLVHCASTDSFIDIEPSRINWLPINARPCPRQGSRYGLMRQDLSLQFL
jgi:hypothetical protein